MSAPAPSVTKDPHYQIRPGMTLVVGNQYVKDSIASKVSNLPIKVILAPQLEGQDPKPEFHGNIQINRYGAHSFVRDTQVTLLDGTICIPYCCMDNPDYEHRFKAILPKSSKHWQQSYAIGYGTGLTKRRRLEILSFVKRHNLPFKLCQTQIEGGSIKIWEDSLGNHNAVIGNHALFLSMISLEACGYFTPERLAAYKASIATPSEEAIRQARNLDLSIRLKEPYEKALRELNDDYKHDRIDYAEYAARIKAAEYTFKAGFESWCFADKLVSLPTDKERAKYKEAAIEFDAKRKLTKRVISEEIMVPLKNIAFVAHQHFHCDMDLFVLPQIGPSGTVFYHDERLAIEVLEGSIYRTRSAREERTIRQYSAAALKREREFAPALMKNLKRIEKICKAVPLAGNFEALGENSVIFMNALALHDVLLSNGSENFLLQNAFTESFRTACPSMKVEMVDLKDGHGMMEFFMTHLSGGINCLSFTHFKPILPEMFVPLRPLGKDIEKWEIDGLGAIGDLIRAYAEAPPPDDKI